MDTDRKETARPGVGKSKEEFLKEHLLLWIPAMVDMLTQAGNSLFYSGMTHLLNGFIKINIYSILSHYLPELTGFSASPSGAFSFV